MPPKITVQYAGDDAYDSRKRNSYMSIMVSTLKPAKNMSVSEVRGLMEALRAATQRIFDTPSEMQKFILFNNHRLPRPGNWDTDIDNIFVKHQVEIGKSKYGGRIHTHIALRIDHHSNIDVYHQRDVIRDLFLNSPELAPYKLKNVAVFVKLHRSYEWAHYHYFQKDAGVTDAYLRDPDDDSFLEAP